MAYSGAGMYGPIEPILHPIHHGIFRFLGFAVLPPFVAYGPARMSDEERRGCLDDYRRYVLSLERVPSLMEPELAR